MAMNRPLGFGHGVDRHDVWVVQGGDGLCLSLEPLDARGIVRKRRGSTLSATRRSSVVSTAR
jgi:hypothetical protein